MKKPQGSNKIQRKEGSKVDKEEKIAAKIMWMKM